MLRSGADIDDTMHQYYEAMSAYEDLMLATNERSWEEEKLEPWFHRPRVATLAKKLLEPYITRTGVEDAAAKYLEQKLRAPGMDRSFLDTLIACELFGFLDHPSVRGLRLSWQLWHWLANVVVAAVVLWLSNGATWALILAAIWVLYPLVWPYLSKQRKHNAALVAAMVDAYGTLDGPISSISQVRMAVEKARDAGTVWPNPLWVMIEDIERRSTTV
jgi:hypothetical protein